MNGNDMFTDWADVPDPLPTLAVPLGTFAGRAGFEKWSEIVASIFDPDISNSEINEFQFGFQAWHLGPLLLAKSRSVGLGFKRTASTINRSGADHYLVQVYETGSCLGSAEKRAVDFEAGDIWIMDLSCKIDTRTSNFSNINLVIPHDMLDGLVADPGDLHGLKLSGRWPLGRMLGNHMRSLAEEAPRLRLREAGGLAEASVNLIAACVGPAIETTDAARKAMLLGALRQVRMYIDVNLGDPDLDPARICKQCGLSRSALYRIFEPMGGVTEYIRRMRLKKCFIQIASPQFRTDRISEIAYRWGFVNDASFSRAFRQLFGISATELRARADERYRLLFGTADSGNSPSSLFTRWMMDLMKI